MVIATQVDRILPNIHRWSQYSPEHRVELTSHAVLGPAGLVIFDPISVSAEILDWFPTPSAPVAVVLTNGNHSRAAAEWRERFGCPILGPAAVEFEVSGVHRFAPGERPLADWQAVPLPGGAPGETAFLSHAQSLVVFGDAVINLPGRPLGLLPDRYCQAPARLRENLRALVATGFERAIFAHGSPLLENASRQMAQLL